MSHERERERESIHNKGETYQHCCQFFLIIGIFMTSYFCLPCTVLLACPDIDDLPPPMTDDDLDALLQAHSSATASAQSQSQCLDAPLLPSQGVESAPLSKSPSPVPSDTDLCLLQTPDTSLSLGSLHVMTSHDIV